MTNEESEEIRKIIEILLEHYKAFQGTHFENLDYELSYWIEKLKH